MNECSCMNGFKRCVLRIQVHSTSLKNKAQLRFS